MKYILLSLCFFIFFSTLYADELITPLPQNIKYDKKKAILGKRLFSEPRLSRDGTISCESCHSLKDGGADNKKFSYGIDGKIGTMNSPTVFNSVFNFAQLWDGRAKNLKKQVPLSLFGSSVMDMDEKEAIKKLENDTTYLREFSLVYPDGVSLENIIDAIAEFEKALVTPNSKFDNYLRGDLTALNDREKRGYKLFKSYGCISCHNGVNIGGNLYQKLGVIKSYPNNKTKFGRYNVTKNAEDKYYFKVPTLRNIALTAPYLHDGNASTLEDVIEIMLEYQVGRLANGEDVKDIQLFLNTLTGEKPAILGEEF